MRSRLSHRPLLALALLAGLLGGCSGEDTDTVEIAERDDDRAKPLSMASGRTVVSNQNIPLGTGRDGGGGARAFVAEKLDLRVHLHEAEVERGRPIMARLELHNLGTKPVVLVSPDELLAKRLHLRVTRGDRRLDLRSSRPPDRDPRPLVLNTAEMISAEVDLLPLLRNTLAYEEGRVRVVAVYDGAADLLPEGTPAWNRDGSKSVTSAPQVLDIVEPRWRAQLGSSRETIGAVANLLITWRPGAPNTDDVKAAIVDRGAEGIRALFYLVSGMSSTRRDSLLRASRALDMLVLVAPQASAEARVLGDVEDPAVAMARDVVLAEVAARLGGEQLPAAKVIESIRPNGSQGTWLSVELVDTERVAAEQYLLDGSGRLTIARPGPGGGRRARQLSARQLEELRGVLLAARPWVWQVARRRRLAGEGRMTVRLSVDGKTLFDVALPEGEALDANPLARRLIDAFAAFGDRVGSR